jgi:large subunit ribosomal protein L29
MPYAILLATGFFDLGGDWMEEKDKLLGIENYLKELFNLRFQHEIGQLDNPQVIKETKRDIARLKSIIQEVALNPKKDNE